MEALWSQFEGVMAQDGDGKERGVGEDGSEEDKDI